MRKSFVRPLTFDSCEGKVLLAGITATLVGDVLVINGGDTADVVQVTYAETEQGDVVVRVTMDASETQDFPIDAVGSISATMGDGKDVVVNATGLDSVMDGGAGADILVGGDGGDDMHGGDGDDILFGRGGRDTLTGDAGADNLNGGDGIDTYNVDGNDTIFTDLGDRVIGTPGAKFKRLA